MFRHRTELAPPEPAGFEEILATLPETIVEVDFDRRVVHVNRPMSTVFSHPVRPGDHIADVLDDETANLVLDIIENAERTGGALAEYRTDQDLIRLSVKPLTSANLTLLVFRNITGVGGVGQGAADLVRDQSNFVKAVSRDLATPLSAVVGYANLLFESRTPLSDETRARVVQQMTEQAADLGGVIEDLLTAASIERGELRVADVNLNLGANLAQVVEALGKRATDVEVVASGDIVAHGDPVRFRQVVRNLLTNALTHGKGRVTVLIASREGRGILAVKDEGAGLPAELARMLGDDASQHTPAQLGLGLWVSQELMRLMRGTLEYHHDGDESRFEVTLPLL